MDSPVIDLPQPDSPTTPSVSPCSMCRSTFPTACTTDLVSWMCVERSLISRTGAIRGYSSALWVKASEAAHRLPDQRLRSRTSIESRSASPIRLHAITTRMMHAPTG